MTASVAYADDYTQYNFKSWQRERERTNLSLKKKIDRSKKVYETSAQRLAVGFHCKCIYTFLVCFYNYGKNHNNFLCLIDKIDRKSPEYSFKSQRLLQWLSFVSDFVWLREHRKERFIVNL